MGRVSTSRALSADWREAFSQGALRMHNAKTISFPTHIEMANGEAVELSISENAQESGPAWFLSYVPIVEHMKLRRDCVAEAKAESEKPRLPKEPLPALMEDGFAGMQESEDYLVNPVPRRFERARFNGRRVFFVRLGVATPQRADCRI